MGDAKREGDWAGPSFYPFTDSARLCTGAVKLRMIHLEAQQIPSPRFAVTVAWVFPIQLWCSALLVASGSLQKGRCTGLSHSGSSAGQAQGWTHGRLEPPVHNDVGFSCGGFIAVPGRTHLPTAAAGNTEVLSALLSPGVCKITGPQEDRPSPGLPLPVRPSCLSLPALEWPPHSCSGSQGLTLGRPLLSDRALGVSWVESTWAMPCLTGPTLVFLPGEASGQRSLAGYSPWGHGESDMTEAA